MNTPYTYRSMLVRVIDADTLVLNVDLGFDVRHKLTVRLLGINAPELSTEAGKAAREWTIGWLMRGDALLTITTHKDKQEKYGRYLALVTNDAGRCLNDDLVTAGHAVAYNP